MYLNRNISEKLNKALNRAPVILLIGARQTGKTTLMEYIKEKNNYSYISFDDIRYIASVKKDPISFIEEIEKPVILDEIQQVPELFLTIKNYVDKNRKSGIFALTGSANPLLLPRLSDSLAGRMEILELFPLSQGEISGKKETFLENIFSGKISELKVSNINKEDLCKILTSGGYPSVHNLNEEDAYAWFESYLTTILQRDVKDLAKIEGLAQLPNLLNLIASRTGALLNVSELSRESKISSTTLHRYLTLLQTLFLINYLLPWSTNLSSRLVKSPKAYLIDSGLLLHILRTNKERLFSDPLIFGKVFENFVISELLKQSSWSKSNVKLYHYRTQTGIEVDVILEDNQGNIFGIEIKGSQNIINDDFKGLRHLQEELKDKFIGGIVLYTGSNKIPFGKNLWTIPVSALWS